MSIHRVSVKGRQVVFGLDWVPLSGEVTESQEVSRCVRELNADYQIRCAHGTTTLYGFLVESDLPERTRLGWRTPNLCAAMLLATFPGIAPNAIWLEVNEQTAKMVVVKDGLPLPSGDFFGPLPEARARILQIQYQSAASFAFYGNDREIYPASVPLSLQALAEQGDIAKATLKRASKALSKSWLAMGALAFFMLASHLFNYLNASNKSAVQKSKNTVIRYAKAPVTELTTAGISAQKMMAFVQSSWPIETLQGGWSLSKVVCTVSACVYHWRLQGGNNLSLQQALPGQHIEFELNGQAAIYHLSHDSIKPEKLKIASLPGVADFKGETGSFLQDVALLGVQARFSDLTPLKENTGTGPSVQTGEVVIEGAAALLEDVLQKLPTAITFESLLLTINGIAPRFRLQGTCYVKASAKA